jgi:exodeoxyribonuclease VII small subunit
MARKSPQPGSFEEAITELESIVSEMESGEVTLEQSLEKYERGTLLIGHCRQVLGAAEKRIEALTKARGDSPAGNETPPADAGTGS